MSPLLVCLIGLLFVVGAILFLRLHAFLALLLAAFIVTVLTTLVPDEYFANEVTRDLGLVPGKLANGFGSGCGKVGLIIAMAAIIGQCLVESRGAERIVNSVRKICSPSQAPKAFMFSGFLMGVPIYFDTVFYLLFPLVREHARRNQGTYLLCLLATVAGASMAHSLVPPTPGPLLVAAELGVSLGVLIPFGIILGLITISVGYAYAVLANRIWPLPIRPMEGLTQGEIPVFQESDSPPPLWLAILPIVMPVLLIVTGTVTKMAYEQSARAEYQPRISAVTEQSLAGGISQLDSELKTNLLQEQWTQAKAIPGWLALIVNKNFALCIGAMLALALIVFTGARKDRKAEHVVRDALMTGGTIILITAAGATFGLSMKESGIAEQIRQWVTIEGRQSEGVSGFVLLWIAFALTAAVRIAQGSATVAMLTSVAVIAPLTAVITLGFHPVYLALVIGCGSKPGPWMNDSGFWVVSRMSGMTEIETLRSFSVLLSIMGLTGFVVVNFAAWLIPFI